MGIYHNCLTGTIPSELAMLSSSSLGCALANAQAASLAAVA
jgi:hypothetical protein